MIRLKEIPEDIFIRIDSLKECLNNDPNVIFAYIFGGLTKGNIKPLSDVDIALYLEDIKRLDYLKLFSKISDVLNTDELDLVILNKIPESLAGRIVQQRQVLIDKQPFIRHEYESLTLRKYFDFIIKERYLLQMRYGIG